MGSPLGNPGAGRTWWKSSSRPSLKFILKTDLAGRATTPPFGSMLLTENAFWSAGIGQPRAHR